MRSSPARNKSSAWRAIQGFLYNDTAASLEPHVDDAMAMAQLVVGRI